MTLAVTALQVAESQFERRPMTSTTKSHSETLCDRMSVTCARMHATYHRLWLRPDLADLLPPFLILMHQIVRASVPLMNTAHALARDRASVDPVCRLLAAYLPAHAAEERDHDEWLLEDLEASGIPRDDVISRIPSPTVASLVGAQYYWIQHHHPVALLGYIRLLEGNPPSASHISRLQRVSGLPAALFRTYRLHGELDPGHLHELDLLLDSLPLSEAQGHLIWISASHTACALADCLQDLERDVAPHDYARSM